MKEQPSKTISIIFPTIGNMLWMAVFFGVLIFGQRMINADGDLALHLSMGRFMLNNQQIPLQDVFSHTLAGQPAAQHKWLAQLIFAAAERIMGLAGVVFLCAIVIATAFWLVFKLARRESNTLVSVVLVVLLGLAASLVHWLIRPHVFTFLFLALWMTILNQLYKGKLQRWWLLPALMVLWVNLHGGFIAGLVTWLLYGLGVGWDAVWGRVSGLHPRFWRAYLLGGGTAFLMTLINPSGVGLWHMLITHLGNPYLAAITVEFQSPNFHQVVFWPFLLMIGLLLVVLSISQKRFESSLVFSTAAWLMMGLYSGRNIPLFVIVAAPLLVQGLDEQFINAADQFKLVGRLKQSDQRIQHIDRQLKGFFWPGLSVLVVIVGFALGMRFDHQGQVYGFDPKVFPVAALDWLEENPQEGEMFNYFTWGGYLQYRLWPEKRVFIDSNSDFYGEAFVREYIQVIYQQEGWEGVLDQYKVNWAIMPVGKNIAYALESELGWAIIYEDNVALILQRE